MKKENDFIEWKWKKRCGRESELHSTKLQITNLIKFCSTNEYKIVDKHPPLI